MTITRWQSQTRERRGSPYKVGFRPTDLPTDAHVRLRSVVGKTKLHVRGGMSIEPSYKYKLKTLTLNEGTEIEPEPLTVLIGPNNSGKSQAL